MATKGTIFLSIPIPAPGRKLLDPEFIVREWPENTIITTEALHAGVSGVDAMLIQTEIPVDKSLLDAAGSQLKVVSTMSTGVDHIDRSECKRRGIAIGYTPIMTDAMADLTVGLLLATSRRFKEGLHAVEQSHFEWENGYWNCGKQLTGSTVGIVGLGRIGMAVAKRLQAFGVSNILYSGPNEKFDATAVGAIYVKFDKLLEESDFVVVCCSLNAENKEMFNEKSFSKMKLDSVFINISRGALVNQEDLYEALTNGTIMAAGLDATSPEPLPADHPLLTLKNCTILPHLGGATIQTRNKMAMTAAKNAIAGFKGLTLPLPVP